MSGYKLYYFDVRGKGEICRLAFAAANIDFEDIRYPVAGDREEWQKEKASGRPPLDQMPFIVTPDGKVLGQSCAIMKYICRQAGLSPTDSFDEALADMITDGVEDLRVGLAKIFYEKDEVKKEELTKDMLENTLPTRLEKFEAILKSRNEGKGFFVGDKLSYPDINFFELMNLIARGKPTVPEQLHKFPLLVEHYKRVLEVPGIKAWVEKRPKTEF
ncbi:hypothetical protein ACROYT_G031591 [Oculina patagonica]